MIFWYSYGGRWKWVIILPILIGMLKLLFAFCFCIPSYVYQQLVSLDYQNFVHTTLWCFLPVLGTFLVQGFIFERGPTIFKVFKEHNLYRFVQIKLHWKTFHPFSPPSIFSLSLSPIQNLKEDLKIPSGMYSTIQLLEIMRLSAFKSPLFYQSS